MRLKSLKKILKTEKATMFFVSPVKFEKQET